MIQRLTEVDTFSRRVHDLGLEDDVLVTKTGARRLGSQRLPIFPDEVENAMKR